MNKHIILGEINSLRIDRFTAPGVYLMAEDEEDILLPNQYVIDDMYVDDVIDVFVYTDSEDRLVATTDKPYAKLHEFAYVNIVDTMKFGAFADWGLPKDLFIPNSKQKVPFKKGDRRIVYIEKDEKSERLNGVEKIQKFLTTDTSKLSKNQEVNILVFATTELGYKVIVNNKYEGLIYKNEVFEKVRVGFRAKAYIKLIRDDHKLDLSLQKIGDGKIAHSKDVVYELLKESNGSLPYNYKSDASLINKIFKMSKKSFKKSLTTLQDKDLIEVKENGIFIKE
ncbi:MAG: DNA-binding protein [Helicobacteraceae bacterium]|nr:DNA-binding protein [Helicobacteraceae bacterium]